MTNILQQYLAHAYSRDGIEQLPASAQQICLDDRRQDDDYFLFCRINVLAEKDGTLTLHLLHAPTNEEVLALVEAAHGEVTDNGAWKEIRVNLDPSEWPYIQQLAKAIRRVVGPGAKYPERNWKFMCPRTAKSPDKLAAHLKQFERMRQKGTLPTFQAKSHSVTNPVLVGNRTSIQKKTPPAVSRDIDDDEENIFKICGVE